MPEFQPPFSHTNSFVEEIVPPFRESHTEALPFFETQQLLQYAGLKIQSIWGKYINAGISNFVSLADYLGQAQEITICTEEDEQVGYKVQTVSCTQDGLGQIVDLIRLIRLDEADSEKAASLTFATDALRGGEYSNLVALVIEDETQPIRKHHFHFVGGNLYAIHQEAKPNVLFDSNGRNEDDQFFSIAHNVSQQNDLMLRLVIGFQTDQESDFAFLRNVGGSLIESKNLRVVDGEAQIVRVNEKGKILTSRPFYIPDAVANATMFQPAITP